MSNSHPDTGGRRWSLVQVRRFSRAAGRAGRCRQLSPACVGSARGARGVRLVSVLGSWTLAATLLPVVDHPESQEVFG